MLPSSPSGPLRVVAYVRVSTTDQASDGVSLAMQRERLAAYALAMGLLIVETIEDAGVSAKTLERPGLRRALELLDQGRADGLLILKLDRLTRSVRDLGDLVERYFASRASLLSVGDSIDTRSAGGRLVLNVLVSVAQWEREAIGERTREALKHLKRQGKKLGAPVLERTEQGARAQQRALELRQQGLSLRRVATVLTAEGFPTRSGAYWSAEGVRLLVARAPRGKFAAVEAFSEEDKEAPAEESLAPVLTHPSCEDIVDKVKVDEVGAEENADAGRQGQHTRKAAKSEAR